MAMTSLLFPTEWEYPENKRSIFKDYCKSFKGQTRHEGVWSFYQPDVQKPQPGVYFMIQEKEISLPRASDLLSMCYTYIVGQSVKGLVQCEGCAIDHPSQTQHLNGCLLSSDEVMELYGEQAKCGISSEDVLKLYTKVREDLDLPPPVGSYDVEAYLTTSPVNTHLDEVFVNMFDRLTK